MNLKQMNAFARLVLAAKAIDKRITNCEAIASRSELGQTWITVEWTTMVHLTGQGTRNRLVAEKSRTLLKFLDNDAGEWVGDVEL